MEPEESRAMAVFFSFHYDRDAWRVQQILRIGAVEGQQILSAQDWEAVKRKGDPVIKKWVADQMAYKTAVVVLVGAQTASRPWVGYEIAYAWNNKKPLVGVRIHGLADRNGRTDLAGPDPFASVSLKSGGTVADHVTLHHPVGSTSQDAYAAIRANLTSWIAGAYRRS
jgi:hypothetical protein